MNDDLLRRIAAWAERRSDIRALILTGSHARPDQPGDPPWDYDVEVFTTDQEKYESSTDWTSEIGDVWVQLPFPLDEHGYLMRLVVFEGGRKVDFGFAPISVLEQTVANQQLNDLYARGYRVLLDKDGLAAQLPPPSYAAPMTPRPTEQEFRAAIEEFFFEAIHFPTHLRRNELWVVKMRDWTMKQLLLRMIEWHAIATKGAEHDIWHIGTRMAIWTTPEVWGRLHDAFGRFDAADSRRALHATIALYRDLARETADAFGYGYPDDVDDAISEYLRGSEV
jgi:aminoglycoside 6-adenylyltransferase